MAIVSFFPVNEEPTLDTTVVVGTRKRGGSSVLQDSDFSRIPKKKSRSCTVTDLQPIPAGDDSGAPVKKNVLLTREKLRAGLTDPKGLLNLVDSSTNALEHTK